MENQMKLLTSGVNGNLIDNVGAPPFLIRILNEGMVTSEGRVECVIFDANIKELVENHQLAAFLPEKKMIVIDLAQCISEQGWIKRHGVLLIPNVWMNMLFAAFHELMHIEQLIDDPSIIKHETLPDHLEREADLFAQEEMEKHLSNQTVPFLNELGWAGDELRDLLNTLFVTEPLRALQEAAIQGTNLVALVVDACQKHENYKDKSVMDGLLKTVDEDPHIGGKIGNDAYLTAAEVLAMEGICKPSTQGGK